MRGLSSLRRSLTRLTGWRRHGLAAAFGFMAALSLPPIDAWPVLALAVPGLCLLCESGFQSWRSAFALGWSFGFGYFLLALHWIGFAFLVDAEDYFWMMPFAVGGLVAFLAVFWGAAMLPLHWLRRQGLSALLILCASLAGAEHLRGVVLTGFPWGAPGLAVDGMGPVAQAAALVGMEGLTPLVLLWGGLWPFLAGGGRPRTERFIAALLLLTLPVLAALGALRLQPSQMTGTLVRIVQPNIPQSDKWRGDNMGQIFDQLIAMSSRPAAGKTPDVIIWPESAMPYLLDESPESLSIIGEMLGASRTLLTGSLRRIADASGDMSKDRVFNSALAVNGEGQVIATYDKWKLVPGGEFLPFESLLAPLGFRKLVLLPGSFEAGRGPHAIKLAGAPPTGMSICYEAIFPNALVNAVDRPEWLVNVTNDGWFGTSTGPHMHLAQARLRSIEQGLPMARAANTGISAVIDAYGRYEARLPLGSEGVLDAPLPAALPETPFARWGAAGLLLIILLLAGIGLQLKAYR